MKKVMQGIIITVALLGLSLTSRQNPSRLEQQLISQAPLPRGDSFMQRDSRITSIM